MTRTVFLLPLLLAGCASIAPCAALATVTLTARVAVSDARSLLGSDVLQPWSSADIDTLSIALYKGTDPTPVATRELDQAHLGQQVSFTNLDLNAAYTIKTLAYAGAEEPLPIHDDVTYDATCVTAFSTTTASTVALPDGIKLKLRDRAFAGHTRANGVLVIPGGYSHTGAETLGVEE